MAPARRARPRPAGTPRRSKAEPTVALSPRRSPLATLGEDPHAHIVCRVCGRIQTLELTELDRHLLTELAGLTPDGWSVERIAYSLAGSCRRCREGPSAE
jgi:Fe2+ or Zn2+ uptake regulation protein